MAPRGRAGRTSDSAQLPAPGVRDAAAAASLSGSRPPKGERLNATSRWRPWHGKPRARDLLCCLAIFISGLYALATIPLTPALIATHPLLLDMISGSNSAILAAGAFSAVRVKPGLAVVIVAALPAMLRFNWVIWWAGRLWGHRVVEKLGMHSPRAAAIAAMAERRGPRFIRLAVLLSALLPVSPAPIYAMAGWVGLRLIPFMILNAIGCAIWATLLATSGYLLGSWGVAVANLVSRYALASVRVLAVAAITPQVRYAWRRRGRSGQRGQ